MSNEAHNPENTDDLRYAHDVAPMSHTEIALAMAFGEYTDAYRAGTSLNADAWIAAHPECDPYDLLEWLIYFHCIEADLPEPDPVPSGELSPAARRAMERIRAMQRQMDTDFN